MKVTSCKSGFTLVELLTVIAIVGILAALSVPALKNLGKSNGTVSASRQLLDDVARARQLAISQHTTVYMVFCPTNFWVVNGRFTGGPWWDSLTSVQKTAATNLCDKQLTGYTFVSLRSVGDQPGRGVPQYLAPWQNLPDGTFIAQWKFNPTVQPGQPFKFTDPIDSSKFFKIYQFNYTNNIPFPTETSPAGPSLPYIAFNYLGQLISGNDQDYAGSGEDIPLAQGSVLPAINPATRTFQFGSPQVSENPPGNSTNISYNIVHIDRLTGRAKLESYKIQ